MHPWSVVIAVLFAKFQIWSDAPAGPVRNEVPALANAGRHATAAGLQRHGLGNDVVVVAASAASARGPRDGSSDSSRFAWL
jgi:hypothetical protein